ncbi:mannose-6-phosphate isomerase, class I [Microbacterium sp. CFBP9034]|uniref:mannose-6-phosphate isomerase, class I n=1 Tax=Microbacterium sp. CFBP9034 TaxID=3096540 RepID=UPI002A6B6B5E|nr:mannose-6-phosphate isomerase, class I [Microbacterium sp. CFBP9034]MDY0909015.1 mannose-6-phosphate isomerase, class I [Microbacterium sp. CFBP9034]
MLVPLTNDPRDYAWGSATLIAQLEGREPSGRPEAEVWFGDHPGDPSETPDGRTLDAWLADEGRATGSPAQLPYLLKLLAAASALSIQAHPSKRQAEAGFAREEAAGIPRDAGERTYRDDNHKPELIVAVSDEFRALAGLRDLPATRRLVGGLGPGAGPLAERLEGADASAASVIGWVLSAEASDDVAAVIAAARAASSDEFAPELELVRTLDEQFPGDPGIVVALLMNLVTLRRGEGLFVPAGVLHAYLSGLGVELMAASDNVLRGGLTPKHIDVAELLSVLDATPGRQPVVRPREVAPGVHRFDVPVADFALDRVTVARGAVSDVRLSGPAIALATAGQLALTGSRSGVRVSLVPGEAVFVSPDEASLRIEGDGELFLAVPGADLAAEG